MKREHRAHPQHLAMFLPQLIPLFPDHVLITNRVWWYHGAGTLSQFPLHWTCCKSAWLFKERHRGPPVSEAKHAQAWERTQWSARSGKISLFENTMLYYNGRYIHTKPLLKFESLIEFCKELLWFSYSLNTVLIKFTLKVYLEYKNDQIYKMLCAFFLATLSTCS